MDLDRTLVFGARDEWIGRLALTSSQGPREMFDFYKENAPKFGWQEITLVRAATSVMSYSRGERVMTVQIVNRTLRGAGIDITLSPRGPQNQPRDSAVGTTTLQPVTRP
jgi:hypothetical protein